MARTQLIDRLVISSARKSGCNGLVYANNNYFPCLLGRSGIGQKTREGDGITPIGCWAMSYLLYRADKIHKPRSFLRSFAISQNDSWCDNVRSRQYNQPLGITLPGSSEGLWRPDNLYDVIVVLDHNVLPGIRGRGSAIFIHIRNTQSKFTQGCIALSHPDLLKILVGCGPQTKIFIRS